jgi:hypothetical protein
MPPPRFWTPVPQHLKDIYWLKGHCHENGLVRQIHLELLDLRWSTGKCAKNDAYGRKWQSKVYILQFFGCPRTPLQSYISQMKRKLKYVKLYPCRFPFLVLFSPVGVLARVKSGQVGHKRRRKEGLVKPGLKGVPSPPQGRIYRRGFPRPTRQAPCTELL